MLSETGRVVEAIELWEAWKWQAEEGPFGHVRKDPLRRCGARGGGAGRVRPPASRRRLCVLLQIGDELVPGDEQFLLVDDVVAVEDGAALVPGQEHGDPVRCEKAAEARRIAYKGRQYRAQSRRLPSGRRGNARRRRGFGHDLPRAPPWTAHSGPVWPWAGLDSSAEAPRCQSLNFTSPTTVRRSKSPKMCCWMVWLNRLVTFTVVVTAPPCHFTPTLPFTVAYASV